MRTCIFRYLFPPLVIGGLAALKTFFIDPAITAFGLQGGEVDLVKRIVIIIFLILMLILLFWIGPKYWGWGNNEGDYGY